MTCRGNLYHCILKYLQYAGAIWAIGTGSVSIKTSLFEDNLVSGFEARGGAVVVEGNRSTPIMIDSVIFRFNRLRGDGAGGMLQLAS